MICALGRYLHHKVPARMQVNTRRAALYRLKLCAETNGSSIRLKTPGHQSVVSMRFLDHVDLVVSDECQSQSTEFAAASQQRHFLMYYS